MLLNFSFLSVSEEVCPIIFIMLIASVFSMLPDPSDVREEVIVFSDELLAVDSLLED
jgi:hypothetical protein